MNASIPDQDFCSKLALELVGVTSTQRIWQISMTHFQSLGIELIMYALIKPGGAPKDQIVFSNMPNWWFEYYQSENLALSDPFYKCCFDFATTKTGSAFIQSHQELTENEAKFIRDAAKTGFVAGFSSPVDLVGSEQFGGWNFGIDGTAKQLEALLKKHGDTIKLMGFIVH